MNSYTKYYSGGESDGADAEYIYVNYAVDPFYKNEHLKIKEYTPKNNTNAVSYKIITHDNEDTNEISSYRSVIFSNPENSLLSFSPPSSIPLEEFQNKYPEITDDIYINECIEGTMINLFYDSRIGGWEIATKSAVGANYWFYRTQYGEELGTQKTFRQMLLDAFRSEFDLNMVPFLQYFPKEYSYTFVLKHPDNHIVEDVQYPIAYLVAVYHICDNRAIYIPPFIYEEWDCFLNIRGIIEFPPSFDEGLKYDDYMTFNNEKTVGYMISNIRTGERCHIENLLYVTLRELRGNNPNLQYHYFVLKQDGKINDFLKSFPQYNALFLQFQVQYQKFVSNLHSHYVSNYIKRTGKKCPPKYFPLVYKLHHDVFIPSMASNNKIIMRKNVVHDYLDYNVSPSALIYHINMSDEMPAVMPIYDEL
jgi:hypothetical protein